MQPKMVGGGAKTTAL